jgi:hypothetical protein
VRLYTLTPLTKRAARSRRAVISGFDLPWRTVKVLGLGAVPALIVALVAWRVMGTWAIFAFLGVEAAVVWAVEGRDTTGLQVKHWRGLLDRRQARLGVLLVCGEPLVGRRGRRSVVVSSSVPVSRPEPGLDDLFGPLGQRER